MNVKALKISSFVNNDACRVKGFFGVSSGTTVSERIEFEGFAGQKYRIAIATEKPFLFASWFFIEKKIQDCNGNSKKVWININSFRKRFSVDGDERAARFLMENLPEKFIPGLKAQVPNSNGGHSKPSSTTNSAIPAGSQPANSELVKRDSLIELRKQDSFSTPLREASAGIAVTSSTSSSGSKPLLIPLPSSFRMGQRPVFAEHNPSSTNSSNSSSPQRPIAAPPIDWKDNKNSMGNQAAASSSSSSAPSPIPPLTHQERVDLIQQTIQKYSSKSKVSNIAQFCFLADTKASELPPETTTALIAGKDHSLKRSILIGPQEHGHRRKFLLLTHVNKENDHQLGRGAYKKAKFAVDLDSGQIKVVTIAKRSNLSSNKNWDNEKKTISHELKNMIQAGKNNNDVVHLDFGHKSNEREEKYYSIMDYCDNGDLSKGKLDANNLQQHQWTLEIARGLATMHQQGILHRDVKPENIFLQQGHIKIGDLGFSCTTKEAETNGIPGTPAYGAPECFKGKKTSIKSDAWSFGCVVFELLGKTKERLCEHSVKQFYGDQDLVNERIDQYIPDPKQRELLKGLLTLDPVQRMTIEEFYNEFSKLPAPQ